MPDTMKLELENRNGLCIKSFSEGEIRIADQVLTGHVILTSEKIIGEWSPPPIEELSIADFNLILEQEPEVIVFGTGNVQRFPNGALTTGILRQGIGFEVMGTAAACRTFNVLVSEYRHVVAALLVR
jgi:uncharacterized protein